RTQGTADLRNLMDCHHPPVPVRTPVQSARSGAILPLCGRFGQAEIPRRYAFREMNIAQPGTTRVGFVGLGLMGRPMAQRVLEAGYQLTVFNRTAEKARPLVEAGAQ